MPTLEYQSLLIVVMMIVLLVTEKETVKFVDLEISHKEKDVSENVHLDGIKPEKDV